MWEANSLLVLYGSGNLYLTSSPRRSFCLGGGGSGLVSALGSVVDFFLTVGSLMSQAKISCWVANWKSGTCWEDCHGS